MKYCLLLISILLSNTILSQKVFEYSSSNEIVFNVFSANENRFKKISNPEDLKTDSPEELVKSYFFATSNSYLSKLFLDKKEFTPKDSSHFESVVNTPNNDMHVQILHKTSYTILGEERCYIMFIAEIKDIPFPFPTLLSLVKKGNVWLIDSLDNQQKLTDALMMFKPCVLANIIEGYSNDDDINAIINKSRTPAGDVDFNKLFEELVGIQKKESLSEKLTMSDNMDCSWLDYKKVVKGKSERTDILPNTSIKIFREQDEALISQIEKNNDSIVLISKLDFEYSNKKYAILKFNRINSNGVVAKDLIRLDENLNPEKPAKELIALFENLKVEIFSDMTPSMNKTLIMDTDLYQLTRGVYGVLNITKLYELFVNRREMFSEYLE